jgi:WD40 repeat protein
VKQAVGLLLGACLLLASACRAFPSGNTETGARNLVNTGHTGAVLGLAFDDRRNLLVSSGDDGTVRLWDTTLGILVRTLQVTQLEARLLAVNPAEPQLAVVVTDGTGSFFLSVWDWEKERQIYRLPLKEEPLFLRFSAMGSFLVYAESSWQSLKILNARDGSEYPFHPEGFGIVGFAEMSRSEKTIMTYQVSGRISYWDIASGQQTLDFPVLPYLSHIRISSDRRLIVGSTGTQIVLVDAVTGVVTSRADYPGATSLDISAAGDEVAAAATGGGMQRWGVSGDLLLARPAAAHPSTDPSLLCYGADALFVANRSGGLGSLSAEGEETPFGDNVLANVSGFAAARGLLVLGSQKWVRAFSTDLLTGASSPTFLHTSLAANPFSSSIDVFFLAERKLLAWRTDHALPGLAVMDLSGIDVPATPPATLVDLPDGFRAPLSDLRASGDSAVGIETGGVVRLTDIATGVSRFELHLPGAATAIVGSATGLVVGRNAAAASGSLLRVDMRTGETVSLKDRNGFTYGLLLDSAAPGGPLLYSVGIDHAGATNLLRHDGPGFERETVLDSIPEEDLDASLALDPDTHLLYASLGRDRIVCWDGKELKTIEAENCAPRRLAARDGLLYSLNKDSTVSVLQSDTGARLAEISLFADGEWCALLRDGRYAASPGGDIHVKVFEEDAPVKATEDYRVQIGE